MRELVALNEAGQFVTIGPGVSEQRRPPAVGRRQPAPEGHVLLRLRRGATRTVLLALAACSMLFGGSYLVGEASPLLQTAPSLGTASSFGVLGGSTVTNTGASTIRADLGLSPGSAVTGFPPGIVIGGTIHAADARAAQAQADTTIAYNALAAQPCTSNRTGQDLGGLTLTAGVYCFSSSAQLTGDLTLNAQGNASAVFVFQIGTTLTTASSSRVLMINPGSACNVYWQVGSSATVGTNTTFLGNILALTSITLNTGAGVSGRALARNGAVTLDTNNIGSSACAVGVATATLVPATATPIPAPPTQRPAPTAVFAATATPSATTITGLPPATRTALVAALRPGSTAATATAMATLRPATRTAVAPPAQLPSVLPSAGAGLPPLGLFSLLLGGLLMAVGLTVRRARGRDLRVTAHAGLTAPYAESLGACALVRGMRPTPTPIPRLRWR